MNMTNIIVINNVMCERIGTRQVKMYGRKKNIHLRSKTMVENHVLNGKWTSIKIR